MRAAVDLEDEPPPLAAARRDVPSLDLVPVGVRHGEALRVSPPAAEPAAPVSGEAAQAALLDRADLARPAVVGRDGGDPPAADRERGADDVALDQPLHRPVEPEAVEVAAAAVADRRDDPLAVEPEHARLARRRVVEVARREEGDRPIEVSREPAEALALDDVEVVVRPAGDALGGLRDADQAERPGRRPSRGGDLAGELGEPLRTAAAHRDLPRLR